MSKVSISRFEDEKTGMCLITARVEEGLLTRWVCSPCLGKIKDNPAGILPPHDTCEGWKVGNPKLLVCKG